MTVWVVSRGEQSEGQSPLAVFRSYRSAVVFALRVVPSFPLEPWVRVSPEVSVWAFFLR